MAERRQEINPILQTQSVPVVPAPVDLHNNDINRLRNQLWIGLLVTNFVVLVITFISRRVMGDPTPPLSLLIQGVLYILIFANLYFLNTKYAVIAQGIYVVGIHLAVPPVLVLYGGTRGFGDIALVVAIIVALLYGWRRWMFITFGAMALTLGWVLYRDAIGEPVAPLLTYSAQFTSIKFVILMTVMVFILRYAFGFYQSMFDKYRQFASEQVDLNQELRLSRQKIVTAREEERRRLRRDLHDGLGPTLAAQMFRVGTAQQLLHKNPEKTATLLGDLEEGIEGTLDDIRRLVYELRPPMLDQLGLTGAITDFVNRHESKVVIKLDLPAQLPPLSAAVEVAVFRIVQTALDNVVKHARATRCDVTMVIKNDTLQIDIVDDGVGISIDYRAGVGLTSMRERAEELGGTLTITNTKPQGTHLSATIPLMAELATTGIENI